MFPPRLFSLIRIHDACKGLTDDDVRKIASHGEIVEMNSGEIIHQMGQDLHSVYLVLLGQLKISAKSPSGVRRTIRYVAPGDQFGALVLLSELESPVDVEADEKSLLFRLDRQGLEELVKEFPRLRRNLLRKLGIAVSESMMKHQKRSHPKVLAFLHADQQTRPIVFEIVKRLQNAGETVGVIGDTGPGSLDPSTPYLSMLDNDGAYLGEEFVRELIKKLSDCKRLVIVLEQSLPIEKMVRLLALADTAFFLATTQYIETHTALIRSVLEQFPSWQKKSHLVVALQPEEPVSAVNYEFVDLVERDFKIPLSQSPNSSTLYEQGISRIVHYVRGVCIGVALSGGAARGMSHLGVLKALDEAGITIDRLAGTSAGVLTGVLYCAGFSPQWGIEHFKHDLEPGSFYKHIPKGDDMYMLMKYRTKSWDQMLRKYLQDWRLEQLPLPCTTVTADLISGKSVERQTGDSVHSILESINLPVLSAPICRDGMLLVDGGLLNNLPADVLIRQGCNFVIGVDVSAIIEHHVGHNTADTPTEQMKSPNAITTLLRALNVQAHNLSSLGAEAADVVIAPDVSRFDASAFTQTPEMAEIGYQATVDMLPRIREILRNLDGDLFKE